MLDEKISRNSLTKQMFTELRETLNRLAMEVDLEGLELGTMSIDFSKGTIAWDELRQSDRPFKHIYVDLGTDEGVNDDSAMY